MASRTDASTVAWARAGIARGITVVVPDTAGQSVGTVLDGWLAYQREHAQALGVDADAVAVFAPSGFVSAALPYVEDPRHTQVKAAVFYYGTGAVQQFRLDLPIMFVRAGLDRPGLNGTFDRLMSTALAQNAPVTIANHSGGPHAFDVVEGGPISDALRDRALTFVREALSAEHRAALNARLAEAHAAGAMASGEATRAAAEYAALVAARPDDQRLRLSHGEALLEAGRPREACDALAPLRGRGLGARDLGVPAARACALAGDLAVAVDWLRSIPKPFRPIQLAEDPAFQRLRSLPEFQALFRD
jgi:dienelactone hydrolase